MAASLARYCMETLLLRALSKGRTSLFVAILSLHCGPETIQCLSCLPHDAAQAPKQALSRHCVLGQAPSQLPLTRHATHGLNASGTALARPFLTEGASSADSP